MSFDFTPYAVGGAAARPDSFSGLDPAFLEALGTMISAAPPDIRANLRVGSGFRSPETQQRLWDDALAKYGSPEVARKWVAPPGRSQHNHGRAADLRYLDDTARKWAHDNAPNFGLNFPLSNEDWHIEPAGARGGDPRPPIRSAPVTAPETAVFPVPGSGPPPMDADAPADRSPMGSLLADIGGNMSGGPMRPRAAPEPMPLGGTGDPMGATVAAGMSAQRARELPMGLRPDIEALMGVKGPVRRQA